MAIDHVAVVRTEGRALAAAGRAAPLSSPVPTCPGWDLGDLVGHVGRVHRYAALALEQAGEPVDRRTLPDPPEDRTELVAWLEEGTAKLLHALDRDLSTPAWNFVGAPGGAGFWARRQAVETTMHRYDAQLAAGVPLDAIDPALARDGIDELLTVLAPFVLRRRDDLHTGGSLHLHCTDVEGEWTLRTEDGQYRVERGHAKGDAAVRGPATALLLLVFGRAQVDDGGLEVFGDAGVLERTLPLLRT